MSDVSFEPIPAGPNNLMDEYQVMSDKSFNTICAEMVVSDQKIITGSGPRGSCELFRERHKEARNNGD